MDSRKVVTQTIPASEARQHLGRLLKRVYNREARIIVEKGGIPIAALVSLADLERWSRLDQEQEQRFAVIDEIRARNRDMDPDQIERDVAEELAAMRRERQEREASQTDT